MKLRRDVLVAVFITFCITSVLFAVKPIGSQTTVQYDPWADINDDGKIDLKDIIYEIRLFGTTGDPTKNVNVTNWPTQQAEPSWKVERAYQLSRQYINVSWDLLGGADGTDWIFVGGYSKMVVYFEAVAVSHTQKTDTTTITLDYIDWGIKTSDGRWMGYSFDHLGEYIINYTVTGIDGSLMHFYQPHSCPVIEVKGPWVSLAFFKISSTQSCGWLLLEVYVYLRNE